jgi:creatinine amidohydrolase/Fe(II)-dependent formamide hydrolase-like protein
MGDHGGGQNQLAQAAQSLDAQPPADGARVVYVGDLYTKTEAQFRETLAKRGLPAKEVHAGIPDTSEMLYLGFGLRKEHIAEANEATGVQGTPTSASSELGKIYVDLKVENAVNQIRSFAASAK